MEADAAFRRSLEVLEEIQCPPELAQTLLAYGRFRQGDNALEDRGLIERALTLFEEMNATGWIAEARAALGSPLALSHLSLPGEGRDLFRQRARCFTSISSRANPMGPSISGDLRTRTASMGTQGQSGARVHRAVWRRPARLVRDSRLGGSGDAAREADKGLEEGLEDQPDRA